MHKQPLVLCKTKLERRDTQSTGLIGSRAQKTKTSLQGRASSSHNVSEENNSDPNKTFYITPVIGFSADVTAIINNSYATASLIELKLIQRKKEPNNKKWFGVDSICLK